MHSTTILHLEELYCSDAAFSITQNERIAPLIAAAGWLRHRGFAHNRRFLAIAPQGRSSSADVRQFSTFYRTPASDRNNRRARLLSANIRRSLGVRTGLSFKKD